MLREIYSYTHILRSGAPFIAAIYCKIAMVSVERFDFGSKIFYMTTAALFGSRLNQS
jgi:hypothetical protein